MKPPLFDYVRPTSLQDTLQVLARNGADAKLLAGGQSLAPILNFRLSAPRLLIDINGLADLGFVAVDDNRLRLGAMTRWHQVETSAVVATTNPLLKQAVKHVAHYQIRNRGTLGGSCAHADPAAELPAVLLACDAEIVLRSENRERVVAADEFFRGVLDTALESDEMIVELRLPIWPRGRRWGFEELARRQGDFAIAGIAALVDEDVDGTCVEARLVAFGVADRPERLRKAEALLRGQKLKLETFAASAECAKREIEAKSDIHSPAEYRRALVALLTRTTLCRAMGISPTEAV